MIEASSVNLTFFLCDGSLSDSDLALVRENGSKPRESLAPESLLRLESELLLILCSVGRVSRVDVIASELR